MIHLMIKNIEANSCAIMFFWCHFNSLMTPALLLTTLVGTVPLGIAGGTAVHEPVTGEVPTAVWHPCFCFVFVGMLIPSFLNPFVLLPLSVPIAAVLVSNTAASAVIATSAVPVLSFFIVCAILWLNSQRLSPAIIYQRCSTWSAKNIWESVDIFELW